MAKALRRIGVWVCAVVLVLASSSAQTAQAQAVRPASQVRSSNSRILEMLREAMRRSPSFGDLIATLDMQDRIVYVEEGTCQSLEFRSCLHITSNKGAKNLVVKIDARQSVRVVIAQLAHELYHAEEIAREPDVIDGSSMRRLYERIGYRSCTDSTNPCWETRAAGAFEELVRHEVASGHGKPTS